MTGGCSKADLGGNESSLRRKPERCVRRINKLGK